MFPWPVRLLGIALAGVELVLLAMNAFGWHFSVPGFEEFMRWLGDQFSSFFAPVEVMIRDILARFDFHLPKLAPHWHHVFVLLWLLMGSFARMFASARAVDAQVLSGRWLRKLLAVDVPTLLWAGICALLTAVMAGTQPLASLSVAAWPVAGFFLFCTVLIAPRDIAKGDWLFVPSALGMTALLAVAAYINPTGAEKIFGFVGENAALLGLVGIVGSVGALVLLLGLLTNDGKTWRERLTNSFTAMGLDIIGAYAIAFALAYVFGGGITTG